MRSSEVFSPFGEFFLSALAGSVRERLAQAVHHEGVDISGAANLSDHAARLAAQFAIVPLVINVENASRSERAETATAERFDIYSGRNAGDSYTRQIVTIHVPFTGNPDLFRCQPLTRTVCTRKVWLVGTEICFEVPVPTHGPPDIKGDVQRMLSCLKQNTDALAQEIAQFNQSLLASATALLEQERAEVQERARVLDNLGLPTKKADAAAATVSAPTARTDAPVTRPQAGIDIFSHVFEVAFSFPGEARYRIGPIARLAQEVLGPDSVFYDEWYKAELARPNLDLHLQGIYTRAALIVPCLCAGYERKEWCGLEWRAIRDLIKKRQDRIMLLRLDDADVPGSFSIDGYIDLRTHDDKEAATLVVRRATGARPETSRRADANPARVLGPHEGSANGPPLVRFAHLKNQHVRVTPVLPVARSQDTFFVRDVTSEVIDLEKSSSGHIISIPAQRVTDDLPVPNDLDCTRLLELNGRLQWLSLSRSWRFFPDRPQSAEERQCGFSRAAAPEDPVITQLQQRGQDTRFARRDNLARYLLQGYQLVYDESGLFLQHGDMILIAAGV